MAEDKAREATMPVIEMRHVHKWFGDFHVLIAQCRVREQCDVVCATLAEASGVLGDQLLD